MSDLSPAAIKQLRETTGAGMMDCKKALTETNGNMEEAVDWLRKKGLSTAAKKAGRVAAEGVVAVATSGTKGVVVELNSETDFVARNEIFQKLAATITELALANETKDIEALKALPFPGTGRTVVEEVAQSVGTIGENLSLRRVDFLSVKNGAVASYIHNAVAPNMGKIAILLGVETEAADVAASLGKQIAMHIAAVRPEALNVAELNPTSVERERAVFKEQALASGKPEGVVEKMIEGRIRKFYEEVVLLEQVFVVDGKSKVSEVVEAAARDAGKPITLTRFVRFQLGDGIEKQATDFAAEVAATAGAAA